MEPFSLHHSSAAAGMRIPSQTPPAWGRSVVQAQAQAPFQVPAATAHLDGSSSTATAPTVDSFWRFEDELEGYLPMHLAPRRAPQVSQHQSERSVYQYQEASREGGGSRPPSPERPSPNFHSEAEIEEASRYQQQPDEQQLPPRRFQMATLDDEEELLGEPPLLQQRCGGQPSRRRARHGNHKRRLAGQVVGEGRHGESGRGMVECHPDEASWENQLDKMTSGCLCGLPTSCYLNGQSQSRCCRCRQCCSSAFGHVCSQCQGVTCQSCLDELRSKVDVSVACSGCGERAELHSQLKRRTASASMWRLVEFAGRVVGKLAHDFLSCEQEAPQTWSSHRESKGLAMGARQQQPETYAVAPTVDAVSPEHAKPEYHTRFPLDWNALQEMQPFPTDEQMCYWSKDQPWYQPQKGREIGVHSHSSTSASSGVATSVTQQQPQHQQQQQQQQHQHQQQHQYCCPESCSQQGCASIGRPEPQPQPQTMIEEDEMERHNYHRTLQGRGAMPRCQTRIPAMW
mmetsp:Transcript_72534/g.151413  ORF Transcript_72534/g.151413 Transcript_72534/m.151413 type:complete len:513 (-) Transcript_72534:163-1701(-)